MQGCPKQLYYMFNINSSTGFPQQGCDIARIRSSLSSCWYSSSTGHTHSRSTRLKNAHTQKSSRPPCHPLWVEQLLKEAQTLFKGNFFKTASLAKWLDSPRPRPCAAAEMQLYPVQACVRASLIRFKGSRLLSVFCCCKCACHTQQITSFYGNLRPLSASNVFYDAFFEPEPQSALSQHLSSFGDDCFLKCLLP